MDFQTAKQYDNEYIIHSYGRFPVLLTKGKGATVQDDTGKTYIDFTSGIGVNALGFCDDNWVQAVSAQLQTLQHTSNLYYTEPCIQAAKLLCEKSGMKKVFFGNSGAEANEGVIKAETKSLPCKTLSMAEPWQPFPPQDRTLTTISSSPS